MLVMITLFRVNMMLPLAHQCPSGSDIARAKLGRRRDEE